MVRIGSSDNRPSKIEKGDVSAIGIKCNISEMGGYTTLQLFSCRQIIHSNISVLYNLKLPPQTNFTNWKRQITLPYSTNHDTALVHPQRQPNSTFQSLCSVVFQRCNYPRHLSVSMNPMELKKQQAPPPSYSKHEQNTHSEHKQP